MIKYPKFPYRDWYHDLDHHQKNNQLFLVAYPNPPKISPKFVCNFLNYPTMTDRQTDRQTHRVKT